MLSITAGQIDDFQDGTTQHWTNGISKPDPTNTSGGRGGPSDLYLQVSSGTFGSGPRLATYNTTQWISDYVAAGVTAVSMDLKNFTGSDESIRIALRASHGTMATPGYASTNKFVVPADNAWHRALFSLDAGSLTAINSPTPLSTFLTSVGEFRIIEADAAPALIGDAGNFRIGVDNIRAVGSPDLSFVESAVSHLEGNSGPTQFVYEVFLSGLGGATVAYATADGPATTADNDYVATSGTLTFAPGQTSQLITVTVNGDTNLEPDENFTLNLSSPTNATIGIGQATGTIISDDAALAANPLHLFYKGSTKWNVTNGATFSDDNAIAPDKTAYLPGAGTSAFSAVSSYDKGINGLMVDFSGAHGAITANDFIFKVGNNNSPSTWATATAPTTVTTRAGAGTGGSDRVELLWADNAIQKQWLEVVFKGNDTLGGSDTNTGLASSYVFYFGNLVGDTGLADSGAFQVTSSDEVNARNNPKTFTATRSDVNDFNRDGSVNSTDQIIARNNPTNLGNQLKFLVVGGGGPFVPDSSAMGGSSISSSTAPDVGIASALVSTTLAGAARPPAVGLEAPLSPASPSIALPTNLADACVLDFVVESESEPHMADVDETLLADLLSL
jgi:hypothetical protein